MTGAANAGKACANNNDIEVLLPHFVFLACSY
jgi:hypothetical protein